MRCLYIALLVVLITISGCTSVNKDLWDYSEGLCENNGGIDRLCMDFSDFFVYCDDGARFTFKKKDYYEKVVNRK